MDFFNKAHRDADYLVEVAHRHPQVLLAMSTENKSSSRKSIDEQLLEIYIEESQRQPMCKRLRSTSHLLTKLVQRHNLNTLVINLYPENEGYSIALKSKDPEGAETETMRLPYEETELLDHIDAEELPPLLLDLLDKSQADLFYSGCVIVELRDYRRSTCVDYTCRYVLLRPTQHTLQCDINALTNDGHRWTQADKFKLESELLLHTNEPLCLDPSPSVFYMTTQLNNKKHTFSTKALKRHMKRYSQRSVNRQRKMAQFPAPDQLKLVDFVARKRDQLHSDPPVNLKVAKSVVDMWKQRDLHLEMPESVNVEEYAKALEKPNVKAMSNNIPVTVEEYTMEYERTHGKVLYTKLVIQQRMSDDFYLGELYTDRDYTAGQMKGTKCRFPLGSRSNVDKYFKQFKEIFTEEGRRNVKIIHQVVGQKPTVTYTQTANNQSASSSSSSSAAAAGTSVQAAVNSAQAQSIITQATNIAASLSQMGAAGDGKKAPIKLSLQINPNPATTSTQSNTTGPRATVHPVTLTVNQQQQLMAAQRANPVGLQLSVQKPPGSDGSTSEGTASTTPVSTTTNQSNLIPPNISITNLQGNVNITNIQGIIPALQNVQVSLAGGTSITVPLNVLNTGSDGSASSANTQTCGAQMTSPQTLVTMVTGNNAMTTNTDSTSSSGNTVPTSMIQLPLGVTQLIPAASLKNPSSIRPNAPISLVQMPGGQPVQLLSAGSLQGGAGNSRGVAAAAGTATLTSPPHTVSAANQSRPMLGARGLTLQPVQQQQPQFAQLHFQRAPAGIQLQHPSPHHHLQQQHHLLKPTKPKKRKK